MNDSFVAIDFEMACYSTLSPCSIGIAVFDHGSLTESRHWLLKPAEPGKFSFTKTHGITWDDVKNQATIKDLWFEIKGLLHNRFIVAHNAIFDLPVLKENVQHYGLEYPDYSYGCTLNMAKDFFPNLKDYKLETVCDLLDIPYGNHDAEADAVSCGRIFARMIKAHANPEVLFGGSKLQKKSYLKNVPDFSKRKGLNLFGSGNSRPGSDEPTVTLKVDKISSLTTIEFFKDKCCVITGNFTYYTRDQIQGILTVLGAKVSSGVTRSIDCLVMGEFPGWSKVEKVHAMIEKGRPITVIDETEFSNILENIK